MGAYIISIFLSHNLFSLINDRKCKFYTKLNVEVDILNAMILINTETGDIWFSKIILQKFQNKIGKEIMLRCPIVKFQKLTTIKFLYNLHRKKMDN